MGVPGFFRWLRRKYPFIVVRCKEEKPRVVDGVKIRVNTSKRNPNGVEFDNLYLDMNGIIHASCFPDTKLAPKNEDEIIIAIFKYIDKLFGIVRPRRLLYMAIDGVAPSGKKNLQRSRRFRPSKETFNNVPETSDIPQDVRSEDAEVHHEKPEDEQFHRSCITPGTPLMARVAKCLHYYVHERLNNDPGWKNIQVILSDDSVPGEGEHKVMDYIRRQRSNPYHDPNTRHCFFGADADVIMLGLASHEPNFTIMREECKPHYRERSVMCRQLGHEPGKDLEKRTKDNEEFIFIRLSVLREYLEKELKMHDLPFSFDLERVIDDWVFICFFIGNDFLPPIPSLEINDGAVDTLVSAYKSTVYSTGGFITDCGNIDLKRVQVMMTNLGYSDQIFKERHAGEIAFFQRQKEKMRRKKLMRHQPKCLGHRLLAPAEVSSKPSPFHNARQKQKIPNQMGVNSSVSGGTQSDRKTFTSLSRDRPTEKKNSDCDHGNDDDSEEPETWKDWYYERNFNVSRNNTAFRRQVVVAFVEGLCWVLQYYYQGCASWNWYFPYHYAPLASDFVHLGDLHIEFEKGTEPLIQYIAVFHSTSRKPFVEEKRNNRGFERLYVRKGHYGYKDLVGLYRRKARGDMIPINPKHFYGADGRVLLADDMVLPGGTVLSPIEGLYHLRGNAVVCVRFCNPQYPADFVFPSVRLPMALDPPKVLKRRSREWRRSGGDRRKSFG